METESQYKPIEPESAVPYWLAVPCVLALETASLALTGWLMINAINSIEVFRYRIHGLNRVRTEEKIKENGYIPFTPRKVNGFFYDHGELGRRATHWTYDKTASSFR